MDTDSVLELLQDVAARVIDPRFRSLADADIAEKKPGDFVTVADREAEVEITKGLTSAYPTALVLGEEAHAADPTLLERFWDAEHAFTVDPIDGTRNFVEGSPDHAVMLSELYRGDVVRSWMWQPQHGVAYVAERGAGAWRNGVRLQAPPSGDVTSWRVVTSQTAWHGARLDGIPPVGPSWICCGVDYPQVATGGVDAVVYRGRQMPWDHAPGSLLLSELGGHAGLTDGAAYAAAGRRATESSVTLVAAARRSTYDSVTAALEQGTPTHE